MVTILKFPAVTSGTGEHAPSQSAVAAIGNGARVLIWCDDGAVHGVVVTAPNVSGVPFQVETGTPLGDSAPSVSALAGGGFVVTWTAGHADSDDSTAIYSQRFDSTGAKVGATVEVNTFTAAQQDHAEVCGLPGGGYVVTWTSTGQDGSGNGVYSQLYDAAGQAVGSEAHVTTATALDQQGPQVSALASGGYVIAWTSDGQDGSGLGVHARTFDASGHAVSAEIPVNTQTAGDQIVTSVTGLHDGGYVVAWTSNEPGMSVGYIQRFDADGAAVGSETRIAGNPTGSAHLTPVVTGTDDGGFFVTWQEAATSGDVTYSQLAFLRFDSTGEPLGIAQHPVSSGAGDLDFDVSTLDGSGLALVWTSDTTLWQTTYAAGADGAGPHLIYGTGGNDTISGLVGVDQIGGGAGDDQLFAEDGQVRVGGDSLYGNAGNDTLTGNATGNTLDGGTGADVMTGGGGNDTYYLDDANDVMVELAGGGQDTVVVGWSYTLGENFEALMLTGAANIDGTGNDLDNGLIGNDGNNLLQGGAGNDFLYGAGDNVAGIDTLDGGAGQDTFSYAAYYYNPDVTGFAFDLAGAETATGIVLSNGTIVRNVEAVKLTDSTGNDTINGGSGDDVMVSQGGTDTFNGGAGNDRFSLIGIKNGAATVDGGDGIDTVVISASGGNIAFNAAFASTSTGMLLPTGDYARNVEQFDIRTSSGNDTLNGGAGNDSLNAGSGTNIVNGGGGDDVIRTSVTAHDTINGGDGMDRLIVSGTFQAMTAGADGSGNYAIAIAGGTTIFGLSIEALTLTGSAADDVLSGAAGDDVFSGSSGNDSIDGGLGNDDLDGGVGNDILTGGQGIDTLTGQLGDDTYVVEDALDLIIEAAGAGTDQVNASITFTLAANIETLLLTGSAAIDGTGNAQNNSLTGNDAVNSLSGLDGNDRLDGGLGADVMFGGAGDDTFVVDNTGDVVVEGANGGTDLVLSSVTWVLGNNVENLTLTGTGDVQAAGNGLNNVLTGNGGNNRFDGVAGADTMAGGGGDDTYVVDQAGDVVVESEGEGIDEVRAAFSYTLGANVDNLVLTGAMAVDGTGNNLNNMLTGNVANNRLNGGSGADTVNYAADLKGITVNLTTGAATGLGIGNDTLSNIENIMSGSGNDTVTGSSASNWLDGGKGADTLTGLAGNDTYVVDNAGDVVVEAGGAGTDVVNAWINYSLGNNVERLNLIGTANIAGTGNGLDNQITGNSGNNKLDGGTGADTLIGGLGNDSYYIDNAGDKAAEATNEGIDQVYASINFTLGSNVENLQLTGSASNGTGNGLNNVIWGTDSANRLDGSAGADKMLGSMGDDTYMVDNSSDQATDVAGGGIDLVLASQSHILSQYVENLTLTGSANITATGNALDNILIGNSGNNRLTGGLGADAMTGGAGHDTYYVDNTGDTVTEGLNAGIDLVQSTVSFTLSDNVENLYLNGSENLNGTGNALNNLITGTSGNNVLDGGAGVDKLFGGLGDDTYYLDNASDSAKDELNGGHDVVYSSASWVMTAYIENLVLTGSANITGTGNALANILTGNEGNNKLDGGTGNDILTGGLGADIFLFNMGSGQDTVTDFTTADTVNLKAYSHGTAFGGGITVVQSGSDVLIDLGSGNTVTVQNNLRADVVSHIVW